jgi:hypothetical protein
MPGRKPGQKYFQKPLDKSLLVCYNKYTEREVITMNNEFMMKFAEFQSGRITAKEWDTYCLTCLLELMEKNQDVLKRLKENP